MTGSVYSDRWSDHVINTSNTNQPQADNMEIDNSKIVMYPILELCLDHKEPVNQIILMDQENDRQLPYDMKLPDRFIVKLFDDRLNEQNATFDSLSDAFLHLGKLLKEAGL